jgi:hypothetical protein
MSYPHPFTVLYFVNPNDARLAVFHQRTSDLIYCLARIQEYDNHVQEHLLVIRERNKG